MERFLIDSGAGRIVGMIDQEAHRR